MKTTSKTAERIKTLSGFTGEAALYRCKPPIEDHEYVVASATHVLGVPETYLFPSDKHGAIQSYSELDGSQRGTLDHDEIFAGLGYTVTSPGPSRKIHL